MCALAAKSRTSVSELIHAHILTYSCAHMQAAEGAGLLVAIAGAARMCRALTNYVGGTIAERAPPAGPILIYSSIVTSV